MSSKQTKRRKFIPLPSQARLKELFDYDEQTGELIWKVSIAKNIKVGQVAGSIKPDGYRAIRIDGTTYRAHRLVWMWVNGEDPEHLTIDHINHQRDDNRIANLRLATRQEQNRYKQNTVGAYLNKERGKYQARIVIDGRNKYLGCYDTLEEATAVYHQKAQELYGAFYYAPDSE